MSNPLVGSPMHFIKPEDGEAFRIDAEFDIKCMREVAKWRLACCDCGLTHDLVLEPHGSSRSRRKHVLITAYRNERATAQRRRHGAVAEVLCWLADNPHRLRDLHPATLRALKRGLCEFNALTGRWSP